MDIILAQARSVGPDGFSQATGPSSELLVHGSLSGVKAFLFTQRGRP